MKQMISKFLLAACCAAIAMGAQPPRKVFPYAYSQEDLPNGLRLVTVPTDYPNIVAVFIVVQTGSRNEVEPGHTGFAHLFEHLMFKGTGKFPPSRYNQTLNRMGAASNASTSDDYTLYHTTFSKEDLETVLMMEADRFQNLKYTEPEFKTETLAVLGEYNKNSSNPLQKLNEVLSDTAFDRHTYKHNAMGFLKDIQDMPHQYAYSLKFFDRYYRPEYTTIIVVGDVKSQARSRATRDLVDKYWGAWKHGSYQPDIPAEPPQEAPRTAHVDWPTPTLPVIKVAFKGPAYSDTTKDTAALDVLSTLAFSAGSDLYQKLVIHEQRVDSLGASSPGSVDPDLFEITARVKKAADLDYVRDQILAAIQAFQEKPVDGQRLDSVRKRLRYQLALRMDNSESIAAILSDYVALRRSPETMNRLFDQYAGLTPEDVRQAAAKYLVEKSRTTVTLTGATLTGVTLTGPGGSK
jgi:zinc protease